MWIGEEMRNGTEERCAICNYTKTPGERFIRCNNCNALFCPFCAMIFLGKKDRYNIDACPACSKKKEDTEERT